MSTISLSIKKYTETKKGKQYSRHIIAISVDQIETLLNAKQGTFQIHDNCILLQIKENKGDDIGKKTESV